jgi:hypothetical protein
METGLADSANQICVWLCARSTYHATFASKEHQIIINDRNFVFTSLVVEKNTHRFVSTVSRYNSSEIKLIVKKTQSHSL